MPCQSAADNPSEAPQASISYAPITTAPTSWDPAQAKITLNARLDARIVPSPASPHAVRVDYSHVVVLDGFLGEAQRCELLDQLTHPGWDHSQVRS